MSEADRNTDTIADLVASGSHLELLEHAGRLSAKAKKLRRQIENSEEGAVLHELQHILTETEAEMQRAREAAGSIGMKRPRGRPTLGDQAMSTAERVKLMRQRDAAAITKVRALLKELRETHPDLVGDVVNDPDVKNWLERG